MARPPQRTYQRLLPPAMGFYRTATGSLPRQNRAVRESGSRLERRQAPREEKSMSTLQHTYNSSNLWTRMALAVALAGAVVALMVALISSSGGGAAADAPHAG